MASLRLAAVRAGSLSRITVRTITVPSATTCGRFNSINSAWFVGSPTGGRRRQATALTDRALAIRRVPGERLDAGIGSDALEELEFLQNPARAFRHGAERIVGDMHRQSSLFG